MFKINIFQTQQIFNATTYSFIPYSFMTEVPIILKPVTWLAESIAEFMLNLHENIENNQFCMTETSKLISYHWSFFYTPWKQKTYGLLVFSGGIEKDQCHEIG